MSKSKEPQEEVKYLVPFGEQWDGSHNECYIYDSEDALIKGLREEFEDNIGDTLQVYEVRPVYKIRLDLGITKVNEGE